MKLHHIGIACHDTEREKTKIDKIYTVVSDSGNVIDKEQNAVVRLLKTAGGPDFELISGGQVENALKKGITYHHLCYEVDDLDAMIKRLQICGGILVSSPKSARLFDMRKAVFFYLSHGLIELLEGKR